MVHLFLVTPDVVKPGFSSSIVVTLHQPPLLYRGTVKVCGMLITQVEAGLTPTLLYVRSWSTFCSEYSTRAALWLQSRHTSLNVVLTGPRIHDFLSYRNRKQGVHRVETQDISRPRFGLVLLTTGGPGHSLDLFARANTVGADDVPRAGSYEAYRLIWKNQDTRRPLAVFEEEYHCCHKR